MVITPAVRESSAATVIQSRSGSTPMTWSTSSASMMMEPPMCVVSVVAGLEEPLLCQDCDGSHPTRVDRLLIRTTAGQAGTGDHDGHIG